MEEINDSEIFKHEPLDLSQFCIRLLELLPQGSDGAVRCIVQNEAFSSKDDHPIYTAVSYEWGDDHEPTCLINICDKKFYIRQNLFDFLTTLLAHHPDQRHQRLWVDAICIDQSNPEEKHHLVPRMKSIYNRAATVLIWLGPTKQDSDMLFDYLQHFEFR